MFSLELEWAQISFGSGRTRALGYWLQSSSSLGIMKFWAQIRVAHFIKIIFVQLLGIEPCWARAFPGFGLMQCGPALNPGLFQLQFSCLYPELDLKYLDNYDWTDLVIAVTDQLNRKCTQLRQLRVQSRADTALTQSNSMKFSIQQFAIVHELHFNLLMTFTPSQFQPTSPTQVSLISSLVTNKNTLVQGHQRL